MTELGIDNLLLIAGAICFVLDVFGVATRVKLLPLGLLFWILIHII